MKFLNASRNPAAACLQSGNEFILGVMTQTYPSIELYTVCRLATEIP
jgi:hypothetical protein